MLKMEGTNLGIEIFESSTDAREHLRRCGFRHKIGVIHEHSMPMINNNGAHARIYRCDKSGNPNTNGSYTAISYTDD